MADILLVKTTDINRVPKQQNQLIFCKDGSFYFDYTDDIRLRNSGSGAQLHDFQEGRNYEVDDMILHEGRIYRSLYNFTPTSFRYCDWQFICTCTENWPIKAIEVVYDDSATSLNADTVQAAIENVVSRLITIDDSAHFDLQIGTF